MNEDLSLEQLQKLTKKEKKMFEKTGRGFLEQIKEIVDNCLLLEDVDKLGRLVNQVHILMDFEVLNTLREKGLDKEITELCDKAGRK